MEKGPLELCIRSRRSRQNSFMQPKSLVTMNSQITLRSARNWSSTRWSSVHSSRGSTTHLILKRKTRSGSSLSIFYYFFPLIHLTSRFCDYGTVGDLIRCYTLPEPIIARIIRDVLLALTYLHYSDEIIIHRDIKASNILLKSKGRVKLSDFGVSTRLARQHSIVNNFAGTLSSIPPVWLTTQYIHKHRRFTKEMESQPKVIFGLLVSYALSYVKADRLSVDSPKIKLPQCMPCRLLRNE